MTTELKVKFKDHTHITASTILSATKVIIRLQYLYIQTNLNEFSVHGCFVDPW